MEYRDILFEAIIMFVAIVIGLVFGLKSDMGYTLIWTIFLLIAVVIFVSLVLYLLFNKFRRRGKK